MKGRIPANRTGGLPVSLIYNVCVTFVVWGLLLPWTLVRILFRFTDRSELWQRLGWAKVERSEGTRRVLIHAVSAGETAAAGAVASVLASGFGDLEILLTAGNRDGLKAGEALQRQIPQVRQLGLLPWDRPHGVRSWLERLDPDLVAVVETEIWPNLFLECQRLHIPLHVINGRIYPRDVSRYRCAKRFFKRVLSATDSIGVQNESERARFIHIGAFPERVQVIGNAKFDACPPDRAAAVLNHRPSLLLVGASTHAPEEKWMLESFRQISHEFQNWRLLLAPRHVRRGRAIRDLASRFGFRSELWSSRGIGRDDWNVMVLDELGYLPALYAQSDLVVIGGSLACRGGHNPLEAAAQGRAIVMGPFSEHFQDIVSTFRQGHALWQLNDRRELCGVLARLMGDTSQREAMGARALALWKEGKGAAAVYASVLGRSISSGA